MYKLFRNILFWFDAEEVHYFSMNIFRQICKISFLKKIISKKYTPENKPVQAFGLTFKNPVGLAAGFDKNAKYLDELETLGFGFIEIGTITPLPQKGNDKPRLFRLPKDKALINRMGFNNDGVENVAKRLKVWKEKKSQLSSVNSQFKHANSPFTVYDSPLIIGGNIGKNKATPNEDAWKDYEICFNELFNVVDYFVVNVSSPNTPGLRELQQTDFLKKILTNLQNINRQKTSAKPLLLKISPDLSSEEIDDILALVLEINLNGLVIANTTISRNNLETNNNKLKKMGAGGLSGKPLKESSDNLLQYVVKKTNRQLPVIASGGIFNDTDAQQKINAGATLVQVWTGFIYEGPGIVKSICNSLHYLHK